MKRSVLLVVVFLGLATCSLAGQLRVRLYRQACDGGSMLECNLLGIMYETGEGVTRDLGLAVTLFQRACDDGIMQSCNRLGVMYGNGRGVTRDLRRAVALFQRACDAGETPSCSEVELLTLGLVKECRSILAPHPSPLAELLDSTSLQREVTDLWDSETGLVLAEVPFSSPGAQDSVWVLSASLTGGQGARLQEILERAAPEGGGPEETLYLFIGDENGPGVRRVRRFAACRPSLLRSPQIARRIQTESAGLGLREQHIVVLRMFVQADGSVGEVRINQSSGNSDVDLAAARVFRTASFEPARIEGLIVPVWIQLPVTFIPSRR